MKLQPIVQQAAGAEPFAQAAETNSQGGVVDLKQARDLGGRETIESVGDDLTLEVRQRLAKSRAEFAILGGIGGTDLVGGKFGEQRGQEVETRRSGREAPLSLSSTPVSRDFAPEQRQGERDEVLGGRNVKFFGP